MHFGFHGRCVFPLQRSPQTDGPVAQLSFPKGETDDGWDYTRGIIIRVLGTFPEALQPVRDALREARRSGPRGLYNPA